MTLTSVIALGISLGYERDDFVGLMARGPSDPPNSTFYVRWILFMITQASPRQMASLNFLSHQQPVFGAVIESCLGWFITITAQSTRGQHLFSPAWNHPQRISLDLWRANYRSMSRGLGISLTYLRLADQHGAPRYHAHCSVP